MCWQHGDVRPFPLPSGLPGYSPREPACVRAGWSILFHGLHTEISNTFFFSFLRERDGGEREREREGGKEREREREREGEREGERRRERGRGRGGKFGQNECEVNKHGA